MKSLMQRAVDLVTSRAGKAGLAIVPLALAASTAQATITFEPAKPTFFTTPGSPVLVGANDTTISNLAIVNDIEGIKLESLLGFSFTGSSGLTNFINYGVSGGTITTNDNLPGPFSIPISWNILFNHDNGTTSTNGPFTVSVTLYDSGFAFQYDTVTIIPGSTPLADGEVVSGADTLDFAGDFTAIGGFYQINSSFTWNTTGPGEFLIDFGSSSIDINPVPEPTSIALLLAGGSGLYFRRRRALAAKSLTLSA